METDRVKIWCELRNDICGRATRKKNGKTNTVCARRPFGWDLQSKKVVAYETEYCSVVLKHQIELAREFKSDVDITTPPLERLPQKGDSFATQEILETNEVIFLIGSSEQEKKCFRNGKKVE